MGYQEEDNDRPYARRGTVIELYVVDHAGGHAGAVFQGIRTLVRLVRYRLALEHSELTVYRGVRLESESLGEQGYLLGRRILFRPFGKASRRRGGMPDMGDGMRDNEERKENGCRTANRHKRQQLYMYERLYIYIYVQGIHTHSGRERRRETEKGKRKQESRRVCARLNNRL